MTRRIAAIAFGLVSQVGWLAPLPAVAQFAAVGLSAVRGQRFANEDLIFYVPEEGDRFAATFAVGDFDGDGADDLAAGVPFDDNLGGSTPSSGIVVVRYGVPGAGLDPDLADTVLSQDLPGSPDPADEHDAFGSVLVACDINQDGFDDLVIGIPQEDHVGLDSAGAIQIHFGFLSGLPADGDTFIALSSPGVPGDANFGSRFGAALACADFDGDGDDDVAVGVPGQWVNQDFDYAGRVVVVRGGAFPLDLSTSYFIDQDTTGMLDQAESSDDFGSALTAGDFDHDGFADLAISVPGEGVNGQAEVGAMQIVYGSAVGLVPGGNQFWPESLLGGSQDARDFVGAALAAGDFDGDGFDDLLIGMPADDFVAAADAGQVFAVHGGPAGLDLARKQFWLENQIHGIGTTEAGDRFGAALAVGDFDGDGFDDAAIGTPGEFQIVSEDGAVNLIVGSPAGLTAARRHALAAGQFGLPGVSNQSARQYGQAVVAGDFDADGHADLAIGAPNENEGGLADVGACVTLYGSLFSDGFENQSTGFWSTSIP